jgi:hypothetical protein
VRGDDWRHAPHRCRGSDVLIATFSKPGYVSETIKVDTRIAAAGGNG